MPSHYLNQCWVIVSWTLMYKLQWIFNQNTKLFIHKNASENIVFEMAATAANVIWNINCVKHSDDFLCVTCLDFILYLSACLRLSKVYMMTSSIKWKHFPRYWPFVRGIHRSPVNSSHKGQWRGALMFSLICIWINAWVNNREAGDLRHRRAHYDVIVMTHSIAAISNMHYWHFL